jgi:putative phosphoesterase
MRVGLISDLHGNAVALRAVLDELRRERLDRIVCLGDVATLGPAPHEVLDRLAELECPCIRGNHDDFLLDAELIHSYTDTAPVVEAVEQCRQSLSPDELAFVAKFQATFELDLDGITLGTFHGSPRSNVENLLSTTANEELEEALGPQRPAVMAGGHTHVQMLRQHRGTLLVNPGSLGLPFEAFVNGGPPRVLPYAEYAIVESVRGALEVRLRRLPLERALLLASLASWDSPLAGYLKQQYST